LFIIFIKQGGNSTENRYLIELMDKLGIKDSIDWVALDKINNKVFKQIPSDKLKVSAMAYIYTKYGIPITYLSKLLNIPKYRALSYIRVLKYKYDKKLLKQFVNYLLNGSSEVFKEEFNKAFKWTDIREAIALYAYLSKKLNNVPYNNTTFGFSSPALRSYIRNYIKRDFV